VLTGGEDFLWQAVNFRRSAEIGLHLLFVRRSEIESFVVHAFPRLACARRRRRWPWRLGRSMSMRLSFINPTRRRVDSGAGSRLFSTARKSWLQNCATQRRRRNESFLNSFLANHLPSPVVRLLWRILLLGFELPGESFHFFRFEECFHQHALGFQSRTMFGRNSRQWRLAISPYCVR
jgi:hypothetical protein